MENTDIVIIGAGVLGLSAAFQLTELDKNIIVVDKNSSFGQEASSRNSEVIHAGLYYKPGSLKAKACIRGRQLLYTFCSQHNIPHKKLGKLVIASSAAEEERIEEIFQNAKASGADGVRFLDAREIKKLEPDINCSRGFFSEETGIIDSHSLMNFFYAKAKEKGVIFSFNTEVIDIKKSNSTYRVTVKEPQGSSFSFQAPIVINAAGINSDKVAHLVGIDIEKFSYKMHLCKGQYFRINHPKKFTITHPVYPPPTPISLGIHITPDLAGGLRLGPDAAYVEEVNYDINDKDKVNFYESVKKFLPSLEIDDLIADTAGIRAKLQAEGEDFRDFVISEESNKGFPGFINLIGIESPGLTSCLAIAEMVENFTKILL